MNKRETLFFILDLPLNIAYIIFMTFLVLVLGDPTEEHDCP